MADNVMLKFQYMGEDVDILVEDIDKVMLIDLIVEYLEKIDRTKMKCPKYPEFSYVYMMKHHYLHTDKDLVDMFSNLEGKKEIYIWVDELTKPNAILNTAFSLRNAQKDRAFVELMDKLCDSENTITSLNVNINDVVITSPPKHDNAKKLTPRRSARHQVTIDEGVLGNQSTSAVEFASFEHEGINNINMDETMEDIALDKALFGGRGRGRGRVGRGGGTG